MVAWRPSATRSISSTRFPSADSGLPDDDDARRGAAPAAAADAVDADVDADVDDGDDDDVDVDVVDVVEDVASRSFVFLEDWEGEEAGEGRGELGGDHSSAPPEAAPDPTLRFFPVIPPEVVVVVVVEVAFAAEARAFHCLTRVFALVATLGE